jgi:ABC-2 type transport system permease protein
VLFCITLARLVTTGMAGLLRSRRGKDFAAFLIVPIFALYEFFAQVVPKLAASGHYSAASFRGLDAWLRWLPPGLAAHAINDASDGHLGTALARLALLAGIIVVLAALWIRELSKALITVDATTQSSRVRGKALPFPRSGLAGTVAARYWVYQRREPTSLVFWAMTAVITAAISARSIIVSPAHPGFILASAAVGAGFIGYFNCDTAGLSGPGFAFELSALSGRRELRAYFGGHAVVLAVIAAPLLTAVSFGLAEVAKAPGFGFLGTAVALAALGASLGVSSLFAVLNPYPMAKRAGNPMRQPAPGHSGQQFLNVLVNVGLTAVLAAPLIVAAVLTPSVTGDVRYPVLIVAGAIYGLALAWGGVRLAAQSGAERLPELSQVAMASKM